MSNRQCSISDLAIKDEERWFKDVEASDVEKVQIPKGHV
jgi:hypothetical protein